MEVRRKTHVQRMTYEEFETRIRDGEIGEQTPVRFEVVTGDEFVLAGTLELYQALRDPRQMAFRRSLTRLGVPLVTALIVGVQIRIYLVSWFPGVEGWLQSEWSNWAPGIMEEGQAYRLLTYGMLHVRFTHILFNLLFLAYTGWNLERGLGRANLAILYFGSVFSGGLLSMAMSPERPSLGASGGAFGLLAAVVIFGWKYWDSIPQRSRKYFGYALVPYLVFSISTGLTDENVDNWGHLGGLLGGVVLATLLEPELLARHTWRNRWVRWVAVVTMIGSGWLLVAMGPRLLPMQLERSSGLEVERPT
ncbi:MAG: rhomboid family intramembrane serine protease, partial [Myxococcota bacterium]|nr:rhomboid family intramembrane serine protease [Myxococcota bacterium]